MGTQGNLKLHNHNGAYIEFCDGADEDTAITSKPRVGDATLFIATRYQLTELKRWIDDRLANMPERKRS